MPPDMDAMRLSNVTPHGHMVAGGIPASRSASSIHAPSSRLHSSFSHLYATSIRLGSRRPQARATLAVRRRHCVVSAGGARHIGAGASAVIVPVREGCDVLHSPKLPRCGVRGMEPENQCFRCATVQTVDLSDAQGVRRLRHRSPTAPAAAMRLFSPCTRRSKRERPVSSPRLIASQVADDTYRCDEHSTTLPSLI
ncbi:hypothetical protein WOLCODRAFT_155696 [Wolfiporia cocos MD-104 SS10]|uniref:Uncharacterized protein n=1 Tax=Wolfiporia cocos (strain MD-104) TaxID=742152 RepID=A0A2H3IZ92_WOLCO|nr:hypothetical protein WOLCODRAFT_155696 [Wolfiporia cocos MD-104 SS10]